MTNVTSSFFSGTDLKIDVLFYLCMLFRRYRREDIVHKIDLGINILDLFLCLFVVFYFTLSKKYPTLDQGKKVAYLGRAQFLIPWKVGPL
jgi:hypothetical protein